MQLSTNLSHEQLLTKWSSALNPLLANLLIQGAQLTNITLAANTPLVINHKLGRQQIGWIISDQNSAANIYRTASFNNLTLTLESSANCTINLWVY